MLVLKSPVSIRCLKAYPYATIEQNQETRQIKAVLILHAQFYALSAIIIEQLFLDSPA